MALNEAQALTEQDPREARLPVWAQDTINGLRRHLADAHNKIDTMKHEIGESDVFVIPRGGLSRDRLPLGRHVSIEFETGKHSGIAVMLDTDRDGRAWLDVRTINGLMLIMPSASNSVKIGSDDHFKN